MIFKLLNVKQINNFKAATYSDKHWLFKALAIGATLSVLSVPAHACQIPKSYYSNVFCTASSRYFIALKDSGQPVALINKQGRRVADLMRYQAVDVNKLKDGLFPVQRLGKVGYVNTFGTEVIPPIYDIIKNDSQTKGWARAVNNNRIVVKKGGKFGVIDTKNRVIIPFSASYTTISDYDGKLAKITTQSTTKWVDVNGNPAIDPATLSASRLPANAVNTPKPTVESSSQTAAISSNQTTSIQAATTPAKMTSIPEIPQTVSGEVWQPEQRDGKWGFVNRHNVPMITFSFNQVTPFSEGLAGVRLQDKWGFVNLAGEVVIPFEFNESDVQRDKMATYKGVQPFVFTGGKAWVANTSSGLPICINTKGKYVACEDNALVLISPQ